MRRLTVAGGLAVAAGRWDYAASNIPSALTAELEEQQEAKRVRVLVVHGRG